MPNETDQATTSNIAAPAIQEVLEIDHTKLFGFRNLMAVMTPDSDLVESADLAFIKRGTEITA